MLYACLILNRKYKNTKAKVLNNTLAMIQERPPAVISPFGPYKKLQFANN